jgi:hypothetical protein
MARLHHTPGDAAPAGLSYSHFDETLEPFGESMLTLGAPEGVC